eukprot:TRINITY_DN1587_c0_g1_i3.p1 TRINITY_DN1587_c0_g1~~TRINITY_DN1587_c0_g1_i3.p1  ORF type:complete len:374 (+),score=26.94 TRINITY_DN1587_c0_g1_i3:48-1124(+)
MRIGRALASRFRGSGVQVRTQQIKWCSSTVEETTDDDWVILGHLDRPIAFEPTKNAGNSVVRGETEMYHLYCKIKSGESSWIEMVDLFCCCDQELVATAYMWALYLDVIPTLYGVKREFARLLHYHHHFDIHVYNSYLKKLIRNGSFYEADRFWERCVLRTNNVVTEPTTHTLNIMLEMVLSPSPEEEEWWLDRGVLYVPSDRKRPTYFRKKIDQITPLEITTNYQFRIVRQCFQAIERYDLQPDFTTLFLMARIIRVEIDLGRHIASQICMYMETLKDDVMPVEARMLISEFLHWKLESVQIDHSLSIMSGARITAAEKMLIFYDDCKNALLYTFRTSDHIPQAKPLGKNQVKIDLV